MSLSAIDIHRFKAGQIIKVYSSLNHISPVPIWHYGVVVGTDDVVHFNLVSEDLEIRIIRTDLKRFVGGGSQLQVCQMSELNATFDRDTIIARALSQVGTDFGGYDLIKNNCEHFANWCICGSKYSNQVPLNEGSRHSIGDKIFEKTVAEPVLKKLDDIDHGLDKLNDKTDDFFDWLGRVRFPWE